MTRTRFGPFEFDPRAGELRKFGVRIKLREQPVKILAILLENPGEVVLREELRSSLWPDDTSGEFDHGINVAIQKLRDALAENAREPRYIETVARRGYRFIAQVEEIGRPDGVPASDGAPEALPQPASPAAPAVPAPIAPTAPVRKPLYRREFIWIAAAAAAAAAGLFIGSRLMGKAVDARVIRFNIPPPGGFAFGGLPAPTVSPDGRRLVFITTSKSGYQMWLRSLELPDAVAIEGAKNSSYPFWSPDSHAIAFFTLDGKLKRIDLDRASGSGQAQPLCDAPNPAGGTWGAGGTILFANQAGRLFRVSEAGGTPVEVQPGTTPHRYPFFLPDGRRFLFVAALSPPGTTYLPIRVGSIDSSETHQVAEGDSNAILAAGRLIYIRDSRLVAQPFDSIRMKAANSMTRLAEPMAAFGGFGNFSASTQGTLLYFAGEKSMFELTWFAGDATPATTLGGGFTPGLVTSYPALSPDGKRLAMDRIDGRNSDIWTLDAASGAAERVTFDPANDVAPVWSPAGHILFASNRKGHFDLYRKAANGSSGDELLFEDRDDKYPRDVSPDGRFLLFDRREDKARQSIWVLPLDRKAPPFPLLESPSDEWLGAFSPNGDWVAYASTESGRSGVYVARFHPNGPASVARQVSPESVQASIPRWSSDGKQIYYASLQRLMAVPVDLHGGSIELRPEHELLAAGATIVGYDVTRDGRRFIVKTRSKEAAQWPITVVVEK